MLWLSTAADGICCWWSFGCNATLLASTKKVWILDRYLMLGKGGPQGDGSQLNLVAFGSVLDWRQDLKQCVDAHVASVHGITAAVDIVVAYLPGWTMCRQTTPFYHTIPSTHQGTITLSSGERHGSQSLFVDCCASRSLHFSYTLGGTGQLSTSCHRNRYPLSIYVDGQTAQRPWTDDTIARPKMAFPVVPRKRHEQIQKRIYLSFVVDEKHNQKQQAWKSKDAHLNLLSYSSVILSFKKAKQNETSRLFRRVYLRLLWLFAKQHRRGFPNGSK